MTQEVRNNIAYRRFEQRDIVTESNDSRSS